MNATVSSMLKVEMKSTVNKHEYSDLQSQTMEKKKKGKKKAQIVFCFEF